MSAFKNPRHEAFARALARGKNESIRKPLISDRLSRLTRGLMPEIGVVRTSALLRGTSAMICASPT
jgi:hypothetical protein